MINQKPEWLKIKVRNGAEKDYVEDLLQKLSLHTVCEQASCPNLLECFGKKTATFMLLGKNCTRNCTFCNVDGGQPTPADETEPERVAQAVGKLGLKHVVITSVTRDDLSDGGSMQFAKTITAVRNAHPSVAIEVLIPDFNGDPLSLKNVIDAKPDILNHNIETVPRLYPEVRPMAVYNRSLELLKRVKEIDEAIKTKSGIMVGFSETENEVIDVLKDLRKSDCDFLTNGQYLDTSKKNHKVMEYVTPEQFERYKSIALELGFKYVASSPLVRSSYNASEAMKSY